MRTCRLMGVLLMALLACRLARGGDGNRLVYLNEFCNPYYPGLDAPKLATPQWIGEGGVEAAIVLSIDDMRDPARYEAFLRPIIDRLKAIDGRGPVSIMTTRVDTADPQLARWFDEGVTVEAHTRDHPCPCLQGSDLEKAKATFDTCVDQLQGVPGGGPVAFRMPCCDSMNSTSPRFFTEIFNRRTPQGNFLSVDSSVFMLFTPADPDLPRNLVIQPDGQHRFAKYVPHDRQFTNYLENYPYPYVIDHLCWELPSAIPDDWQGHNRFGPHHATTIRDMKAAIDCTIVKQGLFTLTFHPGAWIRNDQVIELIDHAVRGRKEKVRFLNFRDVHQRLVTHLLDGHPLRTADGGDNGVRVLDVNADGFMDVVVANERACRTRIWDPAAGRWGTAGFPVPLVAVGADGRRCLTGVQFGVLDPRGLASVLVRSERHAGVWHFDGQRWIADPKGLEGLEASGPVFTCEGGRDRGVRLVDLDGDGICELLAGGPRQSAVFRWRAGRGGWQRLPFNLPAETRIVDEQGRDAGLRLVDVDVDTHPDVVFSDGRRYGVYRFVSMTDGWSQTMIEGRREDEGALPMIVRPDGTNNGVWFHRNHMWVQNEETGGSEPHQIQRRHYTDLLGTDRNPPPRSPQESLGSFDVLPGFRIELVASEPMVMDPVDIGWGPDGKVWIVEYANNPIAIDVDSPRKTLTSRLPSTGGWGRFERKKFGELKLDAGRHRVRLRPDGPTATEVSDLRGIHLIPVRRQ